MEKEAILFTLESAMRSISSRAISGLFVAGMLFAANAYAHSCGKDMDRTSPQIKGFEQISTICTIGANGATMEVKIVFDLNRSKLYLRLNAKTYLIESLGKKFDPSLVGTIDRVRFLPLRLQAYLPQGKLLFISSRRSVGGGGGGQCGSGAEDYLNVVDLNSSSPHVVSRFLIGSCVDGVELADIDKYDEFKSFWVENEALWMHFLNYDGRCDDKLMAYLDGDFRKLRFTSQRSRSLN